ncbi:protein phosphatase [Octadecabacter sp. SW4]|uniref:protein-tyrosine phosphatase family protein n=1 Tax=Octadecabacter sp. SW4 TaxID=2602067 RepID=UPI0011C1FF0D|nr:protein-tyrosine phosphatase family protein [Octadecabacter sp. SW4]QEE36730.1 protein phosphatase [Octadecabacter sp. SW4]
MASDFGISALPVLAGALAITPMPGRGGNYDVDLRALVAWGPQLVVTMTPLAELAAQDMPDDLAARGIGWVHLPIADFGVPSGVDPWGAIEAQALEVLRSGGRVLVHCRAGCGRSGMACLRIMVAAGEDGRTALLRLRAVRPCAVETGEQMDWALGG